MAEVKDAMDKGTLKPDSILKGRKPADIVAQMKAESGHAQEHPRLPGNIMEELERERQTAAARVQTHDAQKAEEADKAAAEKRRKKNARKRAARGTKKQGQKLATVDEDAP